MRSSCAGATDGQLPVMEIEFVEPRAELRPYIESFWIFDSPDGLPVADSSIVAPNGCAKLVIPIENDIVRDADGRTRVSCANGLYFVGNRDSATRLRSTGVRTHFVTIEFRPQGALPIFGVPMSDTANELWDADAVFPHWGRRVREEVAETQGTGPKVALVEERLVERLRANGRTNAIVDWCIDALRTAHGRLAIRELERRTGYSRRHLSSLFRTYVGLPPKVLAGIFRFQKYYRDWAAGRPFGSLATDLYEDYYDQAHFIKEFKRMTGYTPGRFGREVANVFSRRIAVDFHKRRFPILTIQGPRLPLACRRHLAFRRREAWIAGRTGSSYPPTSLPNFRSATRPVNFHVAQRPGPGIVRGVVKSPTDGLSRGSTVHSSGRHTRMPFDPNDVKRVTAFHRAALEVDFHAMELARTVMHGLASPTAAPVVQS